MKTPKEFDYDLWKDNDGRMFIRVKRTGEVCEVNVDTFRVLRNEAMAIYRTQKGIPVYGKKNGKSVLIEHTTMLSLCLDETDEETGIDWLVDKNDTTNEVINKIAIEEFCKLLTDKQLDVLEKCLIGGMSNVEYAKENNVYESAVRKTISLIRKKSKKFFDEGAN